MFEFFTRLKKNYINEEKQTNKQSIKKFLSKNLEENIYFFQNEFDGSVDLTIRYANFDCGTKAAIISIAGMVDKGTLATGVLVPLNSMKIIGNTPEEKFEFIRDNISASCDQTQVSTFEDAFNKLMSGFALIAIDDCDTILCLGLQAFPFRAITEPSAEVTQRGSRESLVEPIMINQTMIRRRMKNPKLKFEITEVGTVSKTMASLCYLTNKVSPKILEEVRKRISKIDIETVTETAFIVPYLENKGDLSMFSGVGMTERPDTACCKISEGKIVILIDGTPNALIVPYLFIEYFHSLDDYSMRPYFATFNRWLKYIAFFLSVLMPGLYVAISTFNPEILPGQILNKIALAVGTTPFSLMTETLIIHFIYEIMREAGLRIPKPLGHAVSIVGALVIGETAVSSGLIGGPTLMVVALTAISSYVIPNLYEPISMLKFIFIIAGGLLGIWGIMIVFTAILVNLCAKNSFGIPFTSPLAPFKLFQMRDVWVRASWKILSKKNINIQDMPGSNI